MCIFACSREHSRVNVRRKIWTRVWTKRMIARVASRSVADDWRAAARWRSTVDPSSPFSSPAISSWTRAPAAPRLTSGRPEYFARSSVVPTRSASCGTRRRISPATPDSPRALSPGRCCCCWCCRYLQRFYRDPRRFRYSCELGAYLRLQWRYFMRARREAP